MRYNWRSDDFLLSGSLYFNYDLLKINKSWENEFINMIRFYAENSENE